MEVVQALVLLLISCGVNGTNGLVKIQNVTSTTNLHVNAFSPRKFEEASHRPFVHSTWRPSNYSSGHTSSPLVKSTSSQSFQKQEIQNSELRTLLTHCNTESVCDLKWDSWVPYLFYSGSEMQLTNQIPLNNFNFTRLNTEITKKGDVAVIGGYAIIRAMALFSGKFRFARTLHSILKDAGFTGERRKQKIVINRFVKKGNFDLALKDFFQMEPNCRSHVKARKTVWKGTVDMGGGGDVIKMAVQNAKIPTLIIKMSKMTIKIKYSFSKKTIKAISRNPFGNFSKLNQAGKNAFNDINGDFSIFFLREEDLLDKNCVSEKLFTFEKFETDPLHHIFATPKTVHDIVKLLKLADEFNLFKKRNELCQIGQKTTRRIPCCLGAGIGAW